MRAIAVAMEAVELNETQTAKLRAVRAELVSRAQQCDGQAARDGACDSLSAFDRAIVSLWGGDALTRITPQAVEPSIAMSLARREQAPLSERRVDEIADWMLGRGPCPQ